ncbi:hypothetical protein A2368_04555 [Candidatus Collierbacteria bacterium RIFOXYB1_FULL_49_13]|uniref:Glutamate--tRNA ligase n=1 Tax=Candidatus Collierbacteria bacterium RIFOXYB1_FULL_49_13 TaxID=1817728 RepID=A0A1F5FF38_9BACT|nr:MAG: hypothetical protein A2368_04555 [Candidatus Collierbacteria bacterium RIFOXYB1_FULL_49_13]
MTTVRTRFAPSPTGFLHVGGLRSAVYPYALARHNGGQFLLRIEDTDQKRFVPGATEKIYSMLDIFGLKYDESFVQSERVKTGIYKKAAEKLVEDGHAYEDEGAIRIKIPKGETVSYHDFALNKDISWKTDNLKDLVLLKSDGFPTYHLAVVVDDHDMGITHVLRGYGWLPSTPLHLLLYKFLGYTLPEIGHMTDILDPEGGKLSKRKGSTSVENLLEEGYLPEAILNFVILLGWAPKDNRELFTLDEFIKVFDPTGFQKSNPIYNTKKLDWFNGQYIRQKSDQDLLPLVRPYAPADADDALLLQIIPLAKQRLTNLKDFATLTNFFFTTPPRHPELDSGSAFLPAIHEVLSTCAWDKVSIESALSDLASSHAWDRSAFFMTLRLAICGQKVTPPLTESMLILGKTESLSRISNH